MRPYWVKVGAKPNDQCPYKKGNVRPRHRDTQGRTPGDVGSQDWGDPSASQGSLAVTSSWERGMKQTLPLSLQQEQVSPNLDPRLLASRAVRERIPAVVTRLP